MEATNGDLNTSVEQVEENNKIEKQQTETENNNNNNENDDAAKTEETKEEEKKEENEEEEKTKPSEDQISQSTVMITTSQIVHDKSDENESAAEKEPEAETTPSAPTSEGEENSNTQSMIVVQSPEITSSMVNEPETETETETTESLQTLDKEKEDEDQQQIDTQNTTIISMTTSTTNNDVDKLVNDYEIPTFGDSVTTNGDAKSIEDELAAKAEQIKADLHEASATTPPPSSPTEKKPVERRIEDETYQEILGNKSLLKKITQYGDQTRSEFSRRPMGGQMVTISYEAYLVNEHDQSPGKLVDHNDNLNFILGDGDVISGLDMIVALMDKDEKCEMIAESRHAYGALGKQPDIPANATLLYKIHLKDFHDITDLNMMFPVERLSLADAKKLRGNFHYNRQDFHLAILSYKKGLAYFNEENLRGDELDDDLKKFNEISQALSMNLALSYYKIGECRDALEALDQVIRVKKNHVKALYIKGKILLQTGETDDAIRTLNTALQLDPENTDIKKELTKAQTKQKLQYENEKKLYKKMISGVSTQQENNSSSRLDVLSKGNKTKRSDSNYFTFLATGLVIAVASVGIAWLARYKNII